MQVASAVIVVAIALAAVPASADPDTSDVIGYRVRKGDTVELVAAELYGDRADAVYIAAANKIAHPRALVPGERLRIPRNRELVTRPGDTWASLARDFLGDERRATFLAGFNDVGDSTEPPPSEPLTAGTAIEVPLVITNESTGPETIAQVVATYLGDPKTVDLVRRYNFLERDTLDKGDKLLVPIMHVKVRPPKQPPADAEAAKRRDRQRDASQVAAAAIPRARDAWADGDFHKVVDVLSQDALDLDYLELPVALEAGVLLGKAYAGLGQDDLAVQTFAKVLRRKPDHALASFSESPKVRALWQKAGGKIDE